jgi:GDP-L-fucose synthase
MVDTQGPIFTLDIHAPVFVAGHNGMVGRALVRRLVELGFSRIITAPKSALDLRSQAAVHTFFEEKRPKYVLLAAARVGGILANATYPGSFIYDNLMIATNVIEASRHYGVAKLLNLGSSCIYPKAAAQPLREASLLTGALEPTNRAYAVAKIAAIELCDHYRAQYGMNFISAMPTNLYGPYDNFDPLTSHVIPAMIGKFMGTKSPAQGVILWGTGAPRREFMYVDDLAAACMVLMDRFSGAGPINIGTGTDLTIRQLAALIAELADFQGAITWDDSKPDGTAQKLLDITTLGALGYTATTPLRDGLRRTLAWYREHTHSEHAL